jgi:hypothetical protein
MMKQHTTIVVGRWRSLCLLGGVLLASGSQAAALRMPFVQLSENGRGFVLEGSRRPFVPWGFNYDHDETGRLLEDYWTPEWPKVEEDFAEMKALGANVVRVHLQFGRFMHGPSEPNEAALKRIARVVSLAERLHLHLDLTGLGCYHKKDVPLWYDALAEQARWAAQACFWEAVAGRCAGSPAVFCYDLMNEPILPGANKETDWLEGEFAGKCFVQRITLDLAGRTPSQVARAWVDRLVAAIRRHDDRHLITVGVIPWALVFPNAKPLFYGPEVAENLDVVSVHFYPDAGQIDRALAALAIYDIGKPLVIEEMFPLKCGTEELGVFIDRSRSSAQGWMGFYWGKTLAECRRSPEMTDALTAAWLELFRKKADTLTGHAPFGDGQNPPRQ